MPNDQPTTYATYLVAVHQTAQRVQAALRLAAPDELEILRQRWPGLAGALEALDETLQRPSYAERHPSTRFSDRIRGDGDRGQDQNSSSVC
jgi:hypothetical protein